ncbi:MAG TPA: hypothetical protein VFN26_04320 [Candidatus Acidoferrum sp.]|nr:hypothetical protein [Candidatus Acidoferrum sp.]
MKKLVLFAFLTMLVVTLSTFPLVLPAVASGTIFGFNLVGPQSTMAVSGPIAGDTLQTTGSGSFDTSTGTIVASGSFTHIKADGTVFDKGAWQANSFVSFTAFGGPNPGLQGGELKFQATFSPNGGTPSTRMVTVVCRINAPAGFTAHEGVTVGLFTDVTRGATLFHESE